MPNPKYKAPRSKTRRRRSHWHLHPVELSECSHCHEPKLPHRACNACGYYAGRVVIRTKENVG